LRWLAPSTNSWLGKRGGSVAPWPSPRPPQYAKAAAIWHPPRECTAPGGFGSLHQSGAKGARLHDNGDFGRSGFWSSSSMSNPVWQAYATLQFSRCRRSQHDWRAEFCCIVPGRPIWSLGCWQAIPHRLPRRGAGLACSGAGPTPAAPKALPRLCCRRGVLTTPGARGKVLRCALEHRAGIPNGLHSSMPLQARPDLAGWVACSGCGALGCEAQYFAPQGIFLGTDEVKPRAPLGRLSATSACATAAFMFVTPHSQDNAGSALADSQAGCLHSPCHKQRSE
jgi:hypothetical protein